MRGPPTLYSSLIIVISLQLRRRKQIAEPRKYCLVRVIVFLWLVFSLIFFVSHGLGIQFNSLQLVSELGLKISGRVKDHKAHKMKTKGIFTEGGVDCSFVVI